MYYIIYASQSREFLNRRDLERLREQSAFYNQASTITGVLIYNEGFFVGIIEGKKKFVKQLWNRIEVDRRHREVIKIAEGKSLKPYFETWSLICEPEYLSYKFRQSSNPEFSNFSQNPFSLQILVNLHAHYLRLRPRAADFDDLRPNFDLRFRLLSNSYHCHN